MRDPSPPPDAGGGGAYRHLTLDVLRGVAVMGILVANLPAFALPEAAYFSPLAAGGTSSADVAAWLATYVLVEGKLRGLFSLLFGASMLLVVERADATGRSGAAVHYRRMAVLFGLGLVHLYALWWGDILSHYALCGAIAHLFIPMRPRALVGTALLLIAWQSVENAGLYAAILSAQAHPDADGARLLAGLADGFGMPSPSRVAAEIAAYRGPYAGAVAYRWHDAPSPLRSLLFLGPETIATMLIGMAGLKSGFLTGAWPRRRYVACAAIGLGLALPVYAAVGVHTARGGFAIADVVFGAMTLAAPLRSVAILGYAALGILLVRPGGRVTRRIAAAGRCALTNYLGTTLVMTTIFYGHGLGLFARWSRAELLLLAPPAWLLMLAWPQPWLARYRHGPVEWLWRSLATGRAEPMRRSDEPIDG